MAILAMIEKGTWQPGIGDSSLMGWITVLAYLGTACACAISGWQANRRRDRRFWGSVAFILLLLGINKQLDLQSWLTVVGKQVAIAQGWYDQRRTVQKQFIVGLVAVVLALLMFSIQALGQSWRRLWLAMTGMAFLGGFIVIRASSFHHIDRLLGLEWAGLRLNWILELGGIICIAVAAVNYSKKQRF